MLKFQPLPTSVPTLPLSRSPASEIDVFVSTFANTPTPLTALPTALLLRLLLQQAWPSVPFVPQGPTEIGALPRKMFASAR